MHGIGPAIRAIFLSAGIVLLTFPVPGDCQQTPSYFKSVEEYIAAMETPNRSVWQKPEQVVDALSIKTGDTVADVGAGSGYFTVLFSRRVRDNGKVFAVDIEKGMIDYIAKRSQTEKLSNIYLVLSTPADPRLPNSSVDLIFMCNTYMYIEKRQDYLKLLMKALKKGGRLAIIDFKAVNTLVGPPLDMRVPRDQVMEEVLGVTGLAMESEYQFLPHQYFLIFRKV